MLHSYHRGEYINKDFRCVARSSTCIRSGTLLYPNPNNAISLFLPNDVDRTCFSQVSSRMESRTRLSPFYSGQDPLFLLRPRVAYATVP